MSEQLRPEMKNEARKYLEEQDKDFNTKLNKLIIFALVACVFFIAGTTFGGSSAEANKEIVNELRKDKERCFTHFVFAPESKKDKGFLSSTEISQ
jgi:ABC-type cobalt transport system substrate-binding protein